MTKYAIGPDVALALAEQNAVISPQHRLLAPTLLRSQVLAQLYGEVRRGRLTRKEADHRLDCATSQNAREAHSFMCATCSLR